mgnify:CR=1 FL=1
MRAVVQRVKRTSVTVGGELKGSAGQGFNVLIGVMQGDTDAEAQLLAAKISKLRVFEDENGKMNKSVLDIGGDTRHLAVHTLRRYQEGQPPVVYRLRPARGGGQTLSRILRASERSGGQKGGDRGFCGRYACLH